MARAGKNRPLRPEALLEHVADDVEGLAVRARDDELRKRRRRERVERDLRFPRVPLDGERPGTLEQRSRKLARRCRNADSCEECAQEGVRMVAETPELCTSGLISIDNLVPAGDAEAGRLDHGQRAEQ